MRFRRSAFSVFGRVSYFYFLPVSSLPPLGFSSLDTPFPIFAFPLFPNKDRCGERSLPSIRIPFSARFPLFRISHFSDFPAACVPWATGSEVFRFSTFRIRTAAESGPYLQSAFRLSARFPIFHFPTFPIFPPRVFRGPPVQGFPIFRFSTFPIFTHPLSRFFRIRTAAESGPYLQSAFRFLLVSRFPNFPLFHFSMSSSAAFATSC